MSSPSRRSAVCLPPSSGNEFLVHLALRASAGGYGQDRRACACACACLRPLLCVTAKTWHFHTERLARGLNCLRLLLCARTFRRAHLIGVILLFVLFVQRLFT